MLCFSYRDCSCDTLHRSFRAELDHGQPLAQVPSGRTWPHLQAAWVPHHRAGLSSGVIPYLAPSLTCHMPTLPSRFSNPERWRPKKSQQMDVLSPDGLPNSKPSQQAPVLTRLASIGHEPTRRGKRGQVSTRMGARPRPIKIQAKKAKQTPPNKRQS